MSVGRGSMRSASGHMARSETQVHSVLFDLC